MGGTTKIALALVLAALPALGGLGCGNGDSTSSGGAGATAGTAAQGSAESTAGGAEPSAEFRTPGGDNSIQTYGEEAGGGERQDASAALEAYMTARGDQDWEAACAELSTEAFQPLTRLVAPGGGCAATLAAVSKRLEPSAWANTMTGPIAALRREGARAFALYHGTAGSDYFIQMSSEGGEWKVAALEPTAFP